MGRGNDQAIRPGPGERLPGPLPPDVGRVRLDPLVALQAQDNGQASPGCPGGVPGEKERTFLQPTLRRLALQKSHYQALRSLPDLPLRQAFFVHYRGKPGVMTRQMAVPVGAATL